MIYCRVLTVYNTLYKHALHTFFVINFKQQCCL